MRNELQKVVSNNQKRRQSSDVLDGGHEEPRDEMSVFADIDTGAAPRDVADLIIDIREYDVPYYMRVAIDLSAFSGLDDLIRMSLEFIGIWFDFGAENSNQI